MQRDFINFINDNQLFTGDDKVLLAVSGGIDSMVMAHLFHEAGFSFAIAHCNFKLRGDDADSDEAFVKQKASDYGVEFFVKRFDTESYANKNKLSIQMAARQLRITWLKKLLPEVGFTCYATAHHRDDELETFFINLLRGTGISGLHGILPKQEELIHPIVFAWREDIEQYARVHNIQWRLDKTNLTDKYTRNRIRHHIIPILDDINPGFRSILSENISRIREAEKIYRKEVARKFAACCQHTGEGLKIAIAPLKEDSNAKTYLVEFLAPCGFTLSTIDDVYRSLYSIPGKLFYSSTHRLVKDRDYLLVHPLDESTDEIYYLDDADERMTTPLPLKMKVRDYDPDEKIASDASIAVLDYDKLRFPLALRKWREGDRFKPLGMKGFKKLSDFFTDEKFSIPEKENTWLLLSGDDIIWLIGHRIDERYKVGPETRKICQLEVQN